MVVVPAKLQIQAMWAGGVKIPKVNKSGLGLRPPAGACDVIRTSSPASLELDLTLAVNNIDQAPSAFSIRQNTPWYL